MQGWRPSTLESYSTYIELWVTFNNNSLNLDPDPSEVTDFLQTLYESELGYSACNTARSALSTFLYDGQNTIGKNPDICRFMRGIMNKNPPMPKLTATWDLDIVLKFFRRKWWPLSTLSLLQLTQRCAMLLSLTTGRRGQNLHLMDLQYSVQRGMVFHFDLRVPVKNYSEQQDHHLLQVMDIVDWPADRRVCPVTTLCEYIRRTKPLRRRSKFTKLFLITQGDFHPASRATIGRWIRSTMEFAGIDTKEFSPHSTRSASASKAKRLGIKTDVVLSRCAWKGENSFAKHYLKPILGKSQPLDEVQQFQSAILSIEDDDE